MLISRSMWASAMVVLLASLAFSCGGAGADEGAVPVSLIQLLVEPEEFSGKQVQVVGFLQKKPTLQLFLTRDHAASLDTQSSVSVSDDSFDGSLTQSDCLGHYVRVTGRFDRLMGVAWAIVGADEVLRMDTIQPCWQRQ